MIAPNPSIVRFISAISVTLVAYSYQFNIYPIYGSLQIKTNEQYLKTNNCGLALTLIIYTTVALIAIAMFGEGLDTVVLQNIGTATNLNGNSFWESYVTQIAFIILLSCHIPFIFFAGKEGLLIIIDELDRKSISNALWHKLNAVNNAFSKDNETELPPNPLLPVPGENFPFLDLDKQASPEQIETQRRTQMSIAKSRLTMVTTAETNRLAYKDMKLKYYLAGTLGFYLVIIVGAIII